MVLYLFIFIIGLCVGSFLNVVLYRKSPQSKRIKLTGHSFCPHCKKKLAWYELFPLLSFLFLRGRCLKCKKPISSQYPLVEFFTGVLFVLSFKYSLQLNFNSFFYTFIIFIFLCIVVSFLVLLFVYDWKHLVLPNSFLYLTLFFVFLFRIILFILNNFDYKIALSGLLAALAAGGFFALLVFVSNERWMGIGDIFLGLIVGFLVGWPNVLLSLFFAFVSGGLIGTVLILLKRKAMKSQIPFGPFLLAGALVGIFWGEKIMGWYL